MSEVILRGIWMELEALLDERPRFTGQIVLHCEGGVVRKYAVTEVRRSQVGAVVVQGARRAEPENAPLQRGQPQ
jgi:hypothetical protein